MSGKNEIVDFSALEEMAEGSEDFIRSVLAVFMDNTPEALKKLDVLVKEKAAFDEIKKQAHFLKSSFGIVQVAGVHAKLQEIESLALASSERGQIESITAEVVALFKEAAPVIKAKMTA